MSNFAQTAPAASSAGSFGSNDVSPNGQRFLMIKQLGTGATIAAPIIIVVQRFAEELKTRVPVE